MRFCKKNIHIYNFKNYIHIMCQVRNHSSHMAFTRSLFIVNKVIINIDMFFVFFLNIT